MSVLFRILSRFDRITLLRLPPRGSTYCSHIRGWACVVYLHGSSSQHPSERGHLPGYPGSHPSHISILNAGNPNSNQKQRPSQASLPLPMCPTGTPLPFHRRHPLPPMFLHHGRWSKVRRQRVGRIWGRLSRGEGSARRGVRQGRVQVRTAPPEPLFLPRSASPSPPTTISPPRKCEPPVSGAPSENPIPQGRAGSSSEPGCLGLFVLTKLARSGSLPLHS